MAAIEERATGTTFAEISKQNFRPIPFLVPSVDVMMAFTRQAELLYRHIALNVTQSVLAGETRDALLPKLLNGEVRAG